MTNENKLTEVSDEFCAKLTEKALKIHKQMMKKAIKEGDSEKVAILKEALSSLICVAS